MISLRIKIIAATMVLLVVAFFVVGVIVSGITSDNLVSQRVSADLERAGALADQLAAPYAAGNVDQIHALLSQSGRALLLDNTGVVQADAYGAWVGVRLEHAEVRSVVDAQRVSDTGFHSDATGAARNALLTRVGAGASHTLMAVSAIFHGSRRIGAVAVVSSADDLVDSIGLIQFNIALYFILIAAAVFVLGYWISGYIARPINDLSSVMTRVMRGDLTARAEVRGRDEVAHLSATFNDMTDKLASLDQARSTFISNASHELKTPLSGIKLMTENMLLDPAMPAEVREDFLRDIKSETDRLTAITGDLLTLVQIDSKGMQLRLSDFDLSESAAATVHRLSAVAERRKLRLSLKTSGPAPVRADRVKIEQVLYNLVDNAVKYTPEGGSVELLLARGEGEVTVAVRDTGIGIPPDDLPHVFDRFFRVDKARSRSSGGTGLGLSIVRDIVTLHEGNIRVESAEGKGSVFTLTLPIRALDEDEDE